LLRRVRVWHRMCRSECSLERDDHCLRRHGEQHLAKACRKLRMADGVARRSEAARIPDQDRRGIPRSGVIAAIHISQVETAIEIQSLPVANVERPAILRETLI